MSGLRCYGKESDYFKTIFPVIDAQIQTLRNYVVKIRMLNQTKQIHFRLFPYYQSDMIGHNEIEGAQGLEKANLCLKYTIMAQKQFMKNPPNYEIPHTEYSGYKPKLQPIVFLEKEDFKDALDKPFHDCDMNEVKEEEPFLTFIWRIPGHASFLKNLQNILDSKYFPTEQSRRSYCRNTLFSPFHGHTCIQSLSFTKDVFHACVAMAKHCLTDVVKFCKTFKVYEHCFLPTTSANGQNTSSPNTIKASCVPTLRRQKRQVHFSNTGRLLENFVWNGVLILFLNFAKIQELRLLKQL